MGRFNRKINKISACLDIELDENGDISNIELGKLQRDNLESESDDYFVDLTSHEREKIGYFGSFYTLIDLKSGVCKKYKTDAKHFTIREVFDNLLDFEIDNRPFTIWDDQIDCDRIFFQGFYRVKKGYNLFKVIWGSS